jgi:hypothetical protein
VIDCLKLAVNRPALLDTPNLARSSTFQDSVAEVTELTSSTANTKLVRAKYDNCMMASFWGKAEIP